MRKLFLLLLSLFAFFLLFTTSAMAQSFPDVPQDHLNYDAIEFLDDQGVINGYEDGTFGPENLVNRAEAAKIIVGAFGIDHDGEYDVIFPDVTDDQWFFPFVMGGWEAGIINGYEDGTFKPANNVKLAETLKMVVLASGVELPSEVSEDVFLDVPKDVWYAPHALYARNKNVVFSDDFGKLNANKDMTRAAFAEVIYRMMVVLDSNGEPFPLQMNWPTFTGEFFKIKYDDQDWRVVANDSEVIFYKPDREYHQFSPGRLYLNSGTVWLTIDENKDNLSKTQYFSNLRSAFPFAEYTEFDFKGLNAFEVLYPNDQIVDWYLYLDDGQILVVYTQYGSGVLGHQLQQVIRTMLSTLEYYKGGGEDYSALLSEIFANVLVEGKGQEMINKLPDSLIIETDAIGVGTGPVDYYYSENLNYTFKYERSTDVILDTREGNTSAF